MILENTTVEGYTLRNFVNSLGNNGAGINSPGDHLLFDIQKLEHHSLLSRLSRDLSDFLINNDGDDLSPVIPDALTSLQLNDLLVFSIGGNGGGFPPHKHTAAWFSLIVGKKEWTFLPPNALSPSSFQALTSIDDKSYFNLYVQAALNPSSQWSNDILSLLLRSPRGNVGIRKSLLRCTQSPSQVVYIPHGWWHSTYNMGDTVGIGGRSSHLYKPALLDITRPNQKNFSNELKDNLYTCCAYAIADLCNGVKTFPRNSYGGHLIRNTIKKLTSLVENDEHRRLGGTGLQSEGDVDTCNAVAQRQITQVSLSIEPLNIKYIVAMASSFYEWPIEHLSKRFHHLKYDPIVSTTSNPALRASKFILKKVKSVYNQFRLNHITRKVAKQLILRMGLFLDEIPKAAGIALACPNAPYSESCGIWGMNHFSHEKYIAIINDTARIFKKLDEYSDIVHDEL